MFLGGHQLGFYGRQQPKLFFGRHQLGFIADISQDLVLLASTKIFLLTSAKTIFRPTSDHGYVFGRCRLGFFFPALVGIIFCWHQLGFCGRHPLRLLFYPHRLMMIFGTQHFLVDIDQDFFWSGLTKAIFLLTSTRVYLIDCQMRQFYGRHRVFLDDVSQ